MTSCERSEGGRVEAEKSEVRIEARWIGRSGLREGSAVGAL
jgi:hypothetical protein